MKRILVAGALSALAFSSWAVETRLAFSKATDIEVFVVHAEGSTWCAESLRLDLRGGGASKFENVEQILPKVGLLLAQQCPQAKTVSWRSLDGQGRVLASGSANASTQWRAEFVPSAKSSGTASMPLAAPIAPSTPPLPVAMSTSGAAPEEVEETPKAVVATPEKSAEAAKPTMEPALSVSLSPELAANEPSYSVLAAADFSVKGWKPRTSAEALQDVQFASPLKDQKSCVFLTNQDFGVSLEFIRVTSEGLHCDAAGRLEGKGSVRIVRTDGRQMGAIEAEFRSGLAFVGGNPRFEIQKITATRLYALIGSDRTLKVHYLLEIPVANNGIWDMRQSRLLALTENEEIFRNEATVSAVLQGGLALLAPLVEKNVRQIDFFALESLDARLRGRDYQDPSLLYGITFFRSWMGRDDTWRYDVQRGRNYLFERDYRLAQQEKSRQEEERRQKKYVLQQQAWKEKANLQRYEQLLKESLAERRKHWIKDVNYVFPGASEYTRLMQGEEQPWRQIVHVVGQEDGLWRIDQPYEALLVAAQPLEKKWYKVSGTVRFDPKKLDGDGMPLTLIQAKYVFPCVDDKCTESFEPIVILRQELDDPSWTPEAARALIERVEHGEFE